MWFIFGGNMIYHNNPSFAGTAGQNPNTLYFVFGILIVLATYMSMINNSIVMAYEVINATYLQSRYQPDQFVTIAFGTLWNFFNVSEDEENGWIRIFVYVD